MKGLGLALSLALGAWGAAFTAVAQDTPTSPVQPATTATTTTPAPLGVTVLGLGSLEGDDEFAHRLTVAVRQAATEVPGWNVSDRDVSLSQLSLAQGCDQPDAACVARIADALNAQRVIYGTVQRTEEREGFTYAVSLYLLNAEVDQVQQSLADSIEPGDPDLTVPARQYVQRLSGVSFTGTLVVQCSTPGAVARVDGNESALDASGVLELALAPGEHAVEITAPGFSTFQSNVTVGVRERSELSATLVEEAVLAPPPIPADVEEEAPSRRRLYGYAAAGMSAVMIGGTVYSWLRIAALQNDDQYVAFAEESRSADVCEEVLQNSPSGDYGDLAAFTRTQRVCREANVLEVLQYVFLGVGVGSAALSGYLFYRSGEEAAGGERPPAPPAPDVAFRLLPLRGGGAFASAGLTF